MENDQKVIQCLSCGNRTLMNLVGEHKYNWDEGDGYHGFYNYQMFDCPICNKPTLLQQYWDVGYANIAYFGTEERCCDEEILYPQNSSDKSLPVEVKQAFDAALKTKNIDKAVCLIALRRTLEIIVKEKNAEGRDLWHKIENLSNKGILPPALMHASRITKTYGNMGAHDPIVNLSYKELDQIIDFVQYILDYLYILPEKLAKIQAKLEADKQIDR